MTKEDVKNIAEEVYQNIGVSVGKLIKFHPKMKTKEVCDYLPCDRHWLYRNKELFGASRRNRRNDLEFDTEKVVNYKLKANTLRS